MISNSKWLYPAVEVTHFFSLFLLVGTIAVVDLRLLGLAGRRQTVTELAEQLFPFLLLLVGIAYHLVVQRNAPKWGASLEVPPIAKLATLAELALWISVITAAVEIPNH